MIPNLRTSCAFAVLLVTAGAAARAGADDPIDFVDRFDRLPEDPEVWRVARGTWQVENVTNRMAYDAIPVTNTGWIRRWGELRDDGPQEWVKRSPNSMRYLGRAKDWGLAVTGERTWAGYRFEASVRSFSKPIGVVFGYQAPNDFFLLHWDLKTLHETPTQLSLTRFTPSGHRVLSCCEAKGAVGQWYRFRVDLEGRRLCVYVDESPVVDLMLTTPVAGGVGLYVEGERGASFDDVSVKTHRRRRIDRPGLLAASEHWAMDGNGMLSPGAQARGLRFASRATDRVLSFSVTLPADRWQFDASIGQGTSGRRYAIQVEPRSLALVALGHDGRSVLESVRTGTSGGGDREFVIDLSVRGFVKLYVDDTLSLRASLPEELTPRFGFEYATPNLRFRPHELADTRAEDVEKRSRVPIFTIDAFMPQWASPQGCWMPMEEPNTYWHKSDFFGRYSVSLPLPKQLTLAFATNAREFDRGYRLNLDGANPPELAAFTNGRPKQFVLTLQCLDRAVAKAKFASSEDEKRIALHKDGHYIWVTVGDEEVLTYRDPEPLTGRLMGLRSAHGLDPKKIRVERNHVKDYYFEQAPTDWRTVGWWEVHNRFDCYPHWWHFATWTEGLSALWNKLEFEGDFTLEFYAGMRMRPWRRWSWYPRLGDLNAAFCADGRDVTSGYNSIIAAWDHDWSATSSQLLRGSKAVDETTETLIPNRETKYQRPLPVPYIARGRPYHGAWYYIRIQRVGSRIKVSCEDVPALEYDDPKSLRGGHFGLWTLSNYMVVARASMSYTKVRRPSPVVRTDVPPQLPTTLMAAASLIRNRPGSLAPADPAKPEQRLDQKTVWGEYYGGLRADITRTHLRRDRPLQVTSPTHPGLWFDFEDGLQGWRPQQDVTDAELQHLASRPGSGRCLRVVNVGQGGLFGASVKTPAIALLKVGELSFDYQLSDGAKINLYLKVSGDWYFVRLTGPSESHHLMRRVGEIRAQVGNWAKACIDVASCFSQADPFKPSWTLEEIFIGNRHEGYLRAGFGGNPDRAAYSIDNLMIVGRGDRRFEAQVETEGDGEPVGVRWVLSKNTVADTRSMTGSTDIAREALDCGRWYLHVRPLSGPSTYPIRLPFDVTAEQTRVAQLAPAAGSKWGGGPIVIEFEPTSGAGPRLVDAQLIANGLEWPLGRDHCRYDATKRRLHLKRQPADLQVLHGDRVGFELTWPTDEPTALTDWRVIGPFDNTADAAFVREDAPELEIDLTRTYEGKGGTTVSWQKAEETAVVDVRKLFDCDSAAVYAVAYVDSLEDRPDARLLAGFDDWGKVWVNGEPAFELKRHGGYTQDEFAFRIGLRKGRNTILVKIGNGTGDWKFGMRVAAPRGRFEWHYTADRGLDGFPPSRVEVADRVADLDFEDGLGTWSGSSAVAERDDATAASGWHSVRMFNPRLQGRFGTYAFRAPFNVGRFPIVAFDYRLPRYARTDLVIDTACYGQRNIVLSDDDNNLGRIGEFENVLRDSQWHHAEMNVAQLMAKRPFQRTMFEATGMNFGDWGYGANGPTTTFHIDNFCVVPVVSARAGVRTVCRAQDLFGIRGYSFCWSDKPDTAPDERINSEDGDGTFDNLPEGERYFHVRACDTAGNWGEPRHFRYRIDNTPPAARIGTPMRDSPMATNELSILLDDGGSGIDPTSLSIAVDGKRTTLDAPFARLDPDTGRLGWNWCLSTKFGSGTVEDGTKVKFATDAIADHAGNTTPGPEWTCTIDHSKDKSPPPGPEMVTAEPYFRFHAFAAELGDWRSHGGRGAQIDQVLDTDKQDYCLRLTNEISGSEFGASMCLEPYDAKQYPFVAFEYKFPKGIRLMVMAYVKGDWRCVRLTDAGYRRKNIGTAPDIAADGKWHNTCFDLGGLLERHLPKEATLKVEKLIIGTWSRSKNGADVAYYIDNFAIFGRGLGTVDPTWVSYDPTGIAGYSVAIDKVPTTVPPTRANGNRLDAWALTDGPWYVHVRAQDGAGNWGATSHVPYFGPKPLKLEPEPELVEDFMPEDNPDA